MCSDHSRQEGAEGVVGDAEDSGDVFPEDGDGWLSSSASKIVNCIGQPQELKGEVSAIIGERSPKSRERESLTRRAAHQHVGLDNHGFVAKAGEVALVGDQGSPLDRVEGFDRVPPAAGLLRIGGVIGRRHEARAAGAVALGEHG